MMRLCSAANRSRRGASGRKNASKMGSSSVAKFGFPFGKAEGGALRPNENKMSDGGRGRASLGVKVRKSFQKWNVQRSAVRSIAWLDVLGECTLAKLNMDTVVVSLLQVSRVSLWCENLNQTVANP